MYLYVARPYVAILSALLYCTCALAARPIPQAVIADPPPDDWLLGLAAIPK